MIKKFAEDLNTANEIKDRLFSAINEFVPIMLRGIAKHNLEQYWWTTLSSQASLNNNYYTASLNYLNNYVNDKTSEVAKVIQDSLRVENLNLVYNFPFKANDFLGEFTVPFPETISFPISDIATLDVENMKYYLLREYAKWVGTHILF